MNRLTRRLLYIALGIAGTLTIGTVGFTVIEGWGPFDSFYMTLTTMTTVGYSEIHPLSRAGRIFNSFLIFFGVSTILIAIGAMTQTVIELEFGDVLSKRRTKRMIDKLQNHFIVCGFGRVGRGAAAELQQAHVPFVVVDRDSARVERAMMSGMLAVEADSTRDETLHSAGIAHARGLRQSVRAAFGQGTEPKAIRCHARGRRGRRGKDAPGGRRRGIRAVFDYRAPAGAGPASAPRGAVSGFRHA
jgi:voltage-gated potassium channel